MPKQIREEVFKTSSLKPWAANPRKISKDAFNQLVEKIKRNGLTQRLKVTEDGTVCDGNMRLEAIKKLGITEVPVTIWDAPSDSDKLEISLDSNESSGEWDEQKLMELAAKSDLDLHQYGITLVSPQPLELVMKNYAPSAGDEIDVPKLDHNLDQFLEGDIKQIVLYFKNEQYKDVIPRIEKVGEAEKLDNNTDIFLTLLEFYENNHGQKKAA